MRNLSPAEETGAKALDLLRVLVQYVECSHGTLAPDLDDRRTCRAAGVPQRDWCLVCEVQAFLDQHPARAPKLSGAS